MGRRFWQSVPGRVAFPDPPSAVPVLNLAACPKKARKIGVDLDSCGEGGSDLREFPVIFGVAEQLAAENGS
jgi:hypothetical protein